MVFMKVAPGLKSVLGSGTKDLAYLGIVLQTGEGGFLQSGEALGTERLVRYDVLAFFAQRITTLAAIVLVYVRHRRKTVLAFDFLPLAGRMRSFWYPQTGSGEVCHFVKLSFRLLGSACLTAAFTLLCRAKVAKGRAIARA
jgi:hypothetical protein